MNWKSWLAPKPKTAARYEHPTLAAFGHYMFVADEDFGIISVFDDLNYDRADADILSPAMRRHVIEKLIEIGFRQTTGNELKQATTGIRCIMPKAYTLGASPFDITRYMNKRQSDFYILTPTQTACHYITHYSLEDAVEHIKALISRHPVNIEKLVDSLEQSQIHQAFRGSVTELRQVQRHAIATEPLSRLKPLGAFGSAAQY